MEENNKYETKENSSGSALYGTEPQPQEDKNIYSSVYGTKLESQEVVSSVQQRKPIEPEKTEPLPEPVSLTKPIESESAQAESVSLTKPIESEPVQSESVSLTKPIESEPVQSEPVSLTKPIESEPAQAESVSLTKSIESEPAQAESISLTKPIAPEPVQPQPVFQHQDFMGGDAIGFGPVQAPPPVQGASASKPKKKKTGLIAGLLCAAAVVIVIGVGVLLVKSLFGDDAKNQLARGFANMTKEMAAYQNSVAEDIGFVELNKLKKTKPMHTNIDLSFTDPQSSGTFSNVGVEIDAVTDYSKKMAEYDLSLGTYGIEMSVGKVVAADNTLYLSVPIIFQDQVYSLDLTNLGRDFNKSAWSKIINETLPEDYSLKLFEDTDVTESIKKTGEMGELYELFQKQSKVIAGATKIETLKEKREFSFDEDSAEYGGVQVTVNKDAYNQAMETLCDDILNSNYYTGFMRGYETTFRGDFDEIKEKVDSVIEHIFSIRFEQDIVLNFYLDRKGRIVNISTPEDLAVSSEYTDLDYLAVDIEFSGTERALDCIEGGVYLQAGEEILYFGISRIAEITEESYKEDLTFILQDDRSSDVITFWYAGSWGYEDQSYEMQMQMDTPDSSLGLSAEGAYTDIEKGECYTIQINNAAITIDGEDLLLMTGSMSTEPAENQIEVPEKSTNVLEMSEGDITSLLYGTLY